MITKKASKLLVTLLAVMLWQSSAAVQAADAYSQIVTFGDSVTDPGNAFVLHHTSSVPPFNLVPDAPYARGGHHFSNGPTWVEQLGEKLHLKHSTGPAWKEPVRASNYAVGGSRARAIGPIYLGTQVGRFLSDSGGAAPADALYVIHIGGDDLRDALVALETDPSGATSFAILGDALSAMQANIVALIAAGARTFVVPNAPDLSPIPEVRLAGPAAQAAGQFLAASFNAYLEALLSGLEAALPVKIFQLDIFALTDEVVSAPAAHGLTDVQDPCITPFTLTHPYCSHPDQFLFWDGIHPTRVGHGFITDLAVSVLAGP